MFTQVERVLAILPRVSFAMRWHASQLRRHRTPHKIGCDFIKITPPTAPRKPSLTKIVGCVCESVFKVRRMKRISELNGAYEGNLMQLTALNYDVIDRFWSIVGGSCYQQNSVYSEWVRFSLVMINVMYIKHKWFGLPFNYSNLCRSFRSQNIFVY